MRWISPDKKAAAFFHTLSNIVSVRFRSSTTTFKSLAVALAAQTTYGDCESGESLALLFREAVLGCKVQLRKVSPADVPNVPPRLESV
jgi:hypothetical protein